ncbi:putative CRISPR-associated protein [Okeania sp. KiyG1]|uniref:putative CRISPR-associated protein n=1 Tax=Okeania sp. KiyG1 TaxID=2720165 RepID=UPI001921564B|nr:putative CRISPR-associated protein [Okeania sp. KiyG1]GGA44765.1 hypothetical protein CYANOKiyG1_63580 [Okeania sp. KiyG1]
MARLVISTVGTSLLTNQIKNSEKKLSSRLRDTANSTENEIGEDVQDIIFKMERRAKKILTGGNILEIQEASAELNGIYELYDRNLEEGKEDIHWLIATNTYQGRKTAKIVRDFLVKQGITKTHIFPESGSNFSTKNTYVFSQGIAKIIRWIEERENEHKLKNDSPAKIVFNLVGGFKAIQGYMNTIGMFYADEIIYIFEGSNQLIRIPKLPIEIKLPEGSKDYKVPLAMMAHGQVSNSWKEAQKVPKEWVDVTEKEMTLSAWGQLVYQQCKEELFSSERLLDFPWLHYQDSFCDDYENITDKTEKVQLHKKLAEVSYRLKESNGDTSVLRDNDLKYSPYKGIKDKDIYHFYINMSLRVSCKKMENGKLSLRYYGDHPHVQGKELKKKK